MSQIVALARGWIGTPYHHQGTLKGIGCDCLGLLRGLYLEQFGVLPTVPPYRPDWAENGAAETLIDGLHRWLTSIDVSEALSGDVFVFTLRRGAIAKHVGILSSPTHFIHAHEGAAVAEIALTAWWQRHVVAAFRFPAVHKEA
jgi:NlpC/P60 family putative phage cell wall peptidase